MIYLVVFWVLAPLTLRWYIARHKYASSGMVMAYVIDMSLIHLPGAMIYLIPWYDPTANSYLVDQGSTLATVRIGFGQSVLGLWSFVVGFIFLSPITIAIFRRKQLDAQTYLPHPKLPINYLRVSLFINLIIFPFARNLPSFNAFFNMSWYLIIVSISLLIWQSYVRGRKDLILRWMQISGVFLPVLTVVSHGYLGFGVRAFMSICMFYLTVFRIRKSTYVKLLFVAYLGLSLFVSYMYQRDAIRAEMWTESKKTVRTIQAVSKILTEFQFFNPMKNEHLEAIDGRLNQNVLVGRAVIYLKEKNQPFANGETIRDAFLAVIPRIIWRDKPMKAGSGNLMSTYTGQSFAEGTSVGAGQVIEFYINFGTWGVVIGFLCFGALIGLLDQMAVFNLKQGNWQRFAFWFLPGMAMMQSGGALAEIVMSSAAGTLFIWTLNKTLFSKYVSRQKRDEGLVRTTYDKSA